MGADHPGGVPGRSSDGDVAPLTPGDDSFAGDRSLQRLLYVSLAAFFLLFQQGAVVTFDGKSMVAVARSLVHQGSFNVPAPEGVKGRRGEFFSKYGPGLSLVVVPAVALAALVGGVVGHTERVEGFLASSMIPLIQAGVGVALYRLARRLGGVPAWSVVVSILALVGTYALAYGKDFFSEPLTTLCSAVAIERLLAHRRLAAGLALALAILTRPQTAAVAVSFVVVVLVMDRTERSTVEAIKRAVSLAVPAALAIALYLAYNLFRFGDPFDAGYQGGSDAFTIDVLDGAGGLLFTPSKSIFLFCPLVVLVPAALWRLRHRCALGGALLLANLVVTFLLVSAWKGWHGDFSWGPRLLLPGVLPALSALVTLAVPYRRPVLALGAVGFAVSCSTLVVPLGAQQLDEPVPRGPAIVRQVTIIPELVGFTARNLTDGNDGATQPRFVLALWQVGFSRQLGGPGVVIAVVGTVVLGGLLVVSAGRLRRVLVASRPPDPRPRAARPPAPLAG